MILLEIDALSVAVLELECNRPRAVHVDRVSLRIESLKTVEVEAWQVQIFSHQGSIQRVETPKNALLQPRIDLRTIAVPKVL